MTKYYDWVEEAARAVRDRVPEVPGVAIVLGSGLDDFANDLAGAVSVPYSELPHWPRSKAVVGHEGRLVVGAMQGRTIAVLSERCHAYEGYDLRSVTFSVRVLGLLGVKTLVLTNAAGGVNTGLSPGALMAIDDHINLMGDNPLVGLNDERFGVQFPDMSEVYSLRLLKIADEVAKEIHVPLFHGIYVALLGPSYETPAEIRYLRAIGADAVGMSTVPEAIVARHMGLDLLGISCITNMAAGALVQSLDHAEVVEMARRMRGRLTALLEGILARL